VKDQLRNLTSLRCRRRLSSRRQHPGTTEIAKGDPGSPESLAQGMLPKGFPMNPGELPISSRKSEEQSYDPICTCEGGEPQGFRMERPRYPLEGRGEQGDVSC
jgi:hypothetical protein